MLDVLRKYHLTARKSVMAKTADYKTEITANLLGTLINDANNVGRNKTPPRDSTLSEIYDTIKYFHKNTVENFDRLKDKEGVQFEGSKKHIQTELELLEGYLAEFADLLPKKLSSEALEEIIKSFMSTSSEDSKKIMGATMAHLKSKYPEQYDGKVASEIIRKHL